MAENSVDKAPAGRPSWVLTAILAVLAAILACLLWVVKQPENAAPETNAQAKPKVYTDRNADPRYIAALVESNKSRMALAVERDKLAKNLARCENAGERAALEAQIAGLETQMEQIQKSMAEVVRARRAQERADRAAVERGEAEDIGVAPAGVAEKLEEFRKTGAAPIPKWNPDAFAQGAKE